MTSASWVRDQFLGRVYSASDEDPEDGGPYCASQVQDSFRWQVIILSVHTT